MPCVPAGVGDATDAMTGEAAALTAEAGGIDGPSGGVGCPRTEDAPPPTPPVRDDARTNDPTDADDDMPRDPFDLRRSNDTCSDSDRESDSNDVATATIISEPQQQP